MKPKLIRSITSFVALSIILFPVTSSQLEAASPEAPEMPEWASFLPAETFITVAVEDVERLRELFFPSDPSKTEFISLERIGAMIAACDPELKTPMDVVTAALKAYLGVLQGGYANGVSAKPEWPTHTFVGNLKPNVKDIGGFLSQEIQPLLSCLGFESAVEHENGVHVLRVAGMSSYFAASGSRFFLSSEKNTVVRLKKGGLSAESTLGGKASFQKAIALVPPEGLFLWVDLKQALSLLLPGQPKGTVKALARFGLDRPASAAFSVDTDDSHINLAFGLTNDGKFTGIPAMLLRPNSASQAAKFIPSDYSIFARWSTAGAIDAYRQWQAIVREMTDDVSWKEYQDALAKLEEKRGFGLDDILSNLGDEVAIAVKLPELIGIPPVLVCAAVKDEAKALDTISNALAKARARPQVFSTINGATICTTTLVPKVLFSYAVKDGYLIAGLSPSSVVKALEVSASGESLLENPRFTAAIELAPAETVFLAYADLEPAARFAAGAAHFVESSIRDMLSLILFDFDETSEPSEIVHVLNAEAEKMGTAVLYATSGQDHVSLRMRVPKRAVSLGLRVAMQQLAHALSRARGEARKTACLNNLRQLALACHMYAEDHEGTLPERLSQLHQYGASLQIFTCPETRGVMTRPEEIDEKSSYSLVGGLRLKDIENLQKMPLLYESLENHKDGACMAFADGHVRFVPAEDYYDILKEAGVAIEVSQ